MKKSAAHVPFDGYPGIVGFCLLPPIVGLMRLWRSRFGRPYFIVSLIGIPVSILGFIFAEAGDWLLALSAAGLVVFALPMFAIIFMSFILLALTLVPVALIGGAFILFAEEAYGFLRFGDWKLHTFLDFQPVSEWLEDRRDWIGLKEIADPVLNYLPLWAVMPVVGVLVMLVLMDDITGAYRDARRDYLRLHRPRGAGRSSNADRP